MDNQEQPFPLSDARSLPLGLSAFGRSKEWELSVDETTSGTDRWFAQIEGPSVYLYFEISSPRVIVDMLAFLEASQLPSVGSPNEMEIGLLGGSAVRIVRDVEFPDRCFLCIQTQGPTTIQISFVADDLEALTNAARQVSDELFPTK
ncbi:MAG: hypothetical protein V4719_08635 [Planctomycetota bacterium]